MVAAATLAMGLPTSLPNLRLHTADAAAFLAPSMQQQGQGHAPYDLVFMDCFDGGDNVPAALCNNGERCACCGQYNAVDDASAVVDSQVQCDLMLSV